MRKRYGSRLVAAVFAACLLVMGGSYLIAVVSKPILDDNARQHAPGEFIRLSDGIVHLEAAGPVGGQVVVFIHGLATPSFIWDKNYTVLAEAGFRVIRYDHYGRGYSDRPRQVYDRDLYDRQLFELLTKRDLRLPVHLVGLSMGGAVVVSFVDRHPEMVDRICLIAPAGFPIEIPLALNVVMLPVIGEWATALFGDWAVREGVRKAFIDPGKMVDFENRFKQSLRYRGFHHALLSTLRNMDMNRMEDVYNRVGRRNIPVLLIWGRQDHVLPLENSQRVLAAIPTAELQVVENAGHNLNYENPESVNSLLRNFLR